MARTWVIAKSAQNIFLLVETVNRRVRFYCTVVCANNSGSERKKLWNDLGAQKNKLLPWVILGDFNVTLNVNEHLNGSSCSSNEMVEFQNRISNIEYPGVYEKFLSYLISDHSPAVVTFPNGEVKKKKAFRLVKRLKNMKYPLNQLNWKEGNVYDRVEKCRERIKKAQHDMEKEPQNERLKIEQCQTLLEYNDAMKDEECLLA
nr:hypothetical protein [Tanacetum cinerariifolium]